MAFPVLAALPILAVLSLMLGLRWSAARAGVLGLLLALALAWTAFGLRAPDGPATGRAVGALAEAAFTTATILWIIVPALAIHRLQVLSGAVEHLRLAFAGLSRDPRLAALIVAWFFALLIEGAAGFGTAAALAAPFLVTLGLPPVTAVAAALVGHVVGVSFGAVGTPILPQVAATGLDPLALSRATGILHGLVGWMVPIAVAVMIHRAYRPTGPDARSRTGAWVVVAAVAFLVPFVGIAAWVGPELPTLGGAVVGGSVFVGILLLTGRRGERAAARIGDPADGAMRRPPRPSLVARAAAPYLALVALVLVTRLVPAVRDTLRSIEWRWELGGEFGGAFLPVYHPGTMLLVALLVGAAWQGRRPRDVASSLGQTVRRMGPVAIALLAMLGLSRVMVHAGMVEVLADAAATAVGSSWPLLAPAVGALGTFVTGSATASNALFSDLQASTAAASGLDPVILLGAQGFGAAVGNAMAPHNVIAAAAVVGLAGREAEILRRTVPLVAPYTLLGGLVALLLTAR